MRNLFLIGLLMLSGCGYKFSPKQISLYNAKGEVETFYSCGSYMRVSSEGWASPTYQVFLTDASGLDHDVYGAKEVIVSDIPAMVDAPFWKFSDDFWYPGARYSNKPDGTPGDLIKEGDVVVKDDNQARVVNGKYIPIKISNPACKKS
jgi:hypothetical protein